MKLKDAVCIVTGAGTGTGAACAIQLASKGARVLVNYNRSEQEARDVVEKCIAAGGDALLAQGNVADDKDCRALAQAALDKWGRIDALINNAGILEGDGFPQLDFASMAKAAGYRQVETFSDLGEFESGIAEFLKQPGPAMAVMKIEAGESYPRDYEYIHSAQARKRFRQALHLESPVKSS